MYKMVRKGDKKKAVQAPPTKGAFLGALIRAGAKFVGARHKDFIKNRLERAAAMGMFGRRRDPNKPRRVRKVAPPGAHFDQLNMPGWLRPKRWGR
jgi:hypothetical protein